MTRLLLDNHPLLFQPVKLHILPLELILDRLFLHLQLPYLIVQLIQFDLLALDLLIVIRQLFLALLLLPLHLSEFMLGVKEVIFALSKGFLGHPPLPLLVRLFVHQVFQFGLLEVQLLLHLAVSAADPINLLLKHLAFVCLVLNVAFHLIDFRLALSDLIFDFFSLFGNIFHRSLLQFNLTLCLFYFVLQTLKKHTLSFTPVLCVVPRINLNFLILSVLQLEL